MPVKEARVDSKLQSNKKIRQSSTESNLRCSAETPLQADEAKGKSNSKQVKMKNGKMDIDK